MSTNYNRKNSFDDNAEAYDKYRSGYSHEVINDIIELSGITAEDKILEIGCGTGQITIDFLSRGYGITAIEKGRELARITAKKFAGYNNFKIVNSSFEEFETTDKFKLVLSAQAFHWIDKDTGIDKTINLLNRSGSAALVWKIDVSQDTEFYNDTNKVYGKYFPKDEKQPYLQEKVDEYEFLLKNRKELTGFIKKEYYTDKLFAKEQYIGLLKTDSLLSKLTAVNREKFLNEISSVIDAHGNRVKRYYKTVLLFCRK